MFSSSLLRAFALLAVLGTGPSASCADELADPTQPLHQILEAPAEASPDAPAPTWELQGIRIDRHHRVALINGQLATVGERVDGARILKIDNESVTLQSGNEPSTLRLLKHEIKQRSRLPR